MRVGTESPYRLNDEQRCRVADCVVVKEGLRLQPGHFERLISEVEESIADFLSLRRGTSFRNTHEKLRALFFLSHENEPSDEDLRKAIRTLPRQAAQYIDRRAPIVIARLFPDEPQVSRFKVWARRAEHRKLVEATRVLTAEGARIVDGRSRGSGRRSGRRIEPIIMGVARGVSAKEMRAHAETTNHGDQNEKGRLAGGRPKNSEQVELVLSLALDWLHASGDKPPAGRSDNKGFGDLIHSVFQWLNLPDGSAAYALRQYWDEG
jgi:hypothetical protein